LDGQIWALKADSLTSPLIVTVTVTVTVAYVTTTPGCIYMYSKWRPESERWTWVQIH